jgi:Rrf2 family protein
MMRLAREYGRGPVLIADLAAEEGIPKKFLEFILLELKQKGMLQSKKGKGGGYLLARHPEEISAGGVLRALDGSLTPVACVGDESARPCADAPAVVPNSRAFAEVTTRHPSILDAATPIICARHHEYDPDLQRYHGCDYSINKVDYELLHPHEAVRAHPFSPRRWASSAVKGGPARRRAAVRGPGALSLTIHASSLHKSRSVRQGVEEEEGRTSRSKNNPRGQAARAPSSTTSK